MSRSQFIDDWVSQRIVVHHPMTPGFVQIPWVSNRRANRLLGSMVRLDLVDYWLDAASPLTFELCLVKVGDPDILDLTSLVQVFHMRQLSAAELAVNQEHVE